LQDASIALILRSSDYFVNQPVGWQNASWDLQSTSPRWRAGGVNGRRQPLPENRRNTTRPKEI